MSFRHGMRRAAGNVGLDISLGLSNHWSLDSFNASNQVEDSKGIHNLTRQGSIDISADGLIDSCANNSTVSSYLYKNNITDYHPFNSGSFSVAVWLNLVSGQSTSTYPHLMSFGDYADGGFVIHTVNPVTAVYFNLGSLTGWNASLSVAISPAVWNHFVATFNNGTLAIFLNGNMVGSPATGKVWTNPRANYNNLKFFWGMESRHTTYGKLDDVRFYEKALSLEEVQVLYNYRGL